MVWKGLGLMGGAARDDFGQKIWNMVVERCGKESLFVSDVNDVYRRWSLRPKGLMSIYRHLKTLANQIRAFKTQVHQKNRLSNQNFNEQRPRVRQLSGLGLGFVK